MGAGSLLVTGGARSGKTRYALECALVHPPPRVYVATGEAGDDEMAARIAAHRRQRGDAFTTVEEPRALDRALGRPSPTGVVVVDCLTLWIANLMAGEDDGAIHAAVERLAAQVAASRFPLIVVTNDVGSGIVPFDPVLRRYRDLLGSANQRLAAVAERVVLMVAGLPLGVKPSPGTG